jgi:hypothetical protein
MPRYRREHVPNINISNIRVRFTSRPLIEHHKPRRAGLVRDGLVNRLQLAVGGDEGIDQAEQLLLGFCRHAFDESEATFEPRADGECGGLTLGADAEQGHKAYKAGVLEHAL